MFKLAAWALAATFPSTAHLPGLDRIDTLPFLRQLSRESPLLIRLAMFGSVMVFHLSPLLTIGIPLPAFWLPRARLDRHVMKLATHRIYLLRQTMTMVKTIGGLVWGAHPDVRRALAMTPYQPDPGTWRV